MYVSRRECDKVALDLRGAGIGAQAYHAGLTDAERTAVQERWMAEGPCKVREYPLSMMIMFGYIQILWCIVSCTRRLHWTPSRVRTGHLRPLN